MKRAGLLLLFSFLVFGVVIGNFVVAKDDNSSGSNSGSSLDDSNSVISAADNSGSSDDDDENETEIEDEADEEDDDENETEDDNEVNERQRSFIKEVVREDGSRMVFEKRVEVKDGKIKVKIIKRVTDANGTRKITIEIERNAEGIEKKIKFEGFRDFNATTDLEIDLNENETDFGVILSNGRRAEVKIMPDTASQIALERLRALNFTVELKEVGRRAVYGVEIDKEGRLLGIFKLKFKEEGRVDSETGEFLGVSRPFWAFLVTGEDDEDEIIGNETNSSS